MNDARAGVKYLALYSWAGTTYHPIEVVGQTPKRYRVRILERGGLALPSRRYADYGDVVLVPKYAVRDEPGNPYWGTITFED